MNGETSSIIQQPCDTFGQLQDYSPGITICLNPLMSFAMDLPLENLAGEILAKHLQLNPHQQIIVSDSAIPIAYEHSIWQCSRTLMSMNQLDLPNHLRSHVVLLGVSENGEHEPFE